MSIIEGFFRTLLGTGHVIGHMATETARGYGSDRQRRFRISAAEEGFLAFMCLTDMDLEMELQKKMCDPEQFDCVWEELEDIARMYPEIAQELPDFTASRKKLYYEFNYFDVPFDERGKHYRLQEEADRNRWSAKYLLMRKRGKLPYGYAKIAILNPAKNFLPGREGSIWSYLTPKEYLATEGRTSLRHYWVDPACKYDTTYAGFEVDNRFSPEKALIFENPYMRDSRCESFLNGVWPDWKSQNQKRLDSPVSYHPGNSEETNWRQLETVMTERILNTTRKQYEDWVWNEIEGEIERIGKLSNHYKGRDRLPRHCVALSVMTEEMKKQHGRIPLAIPREVPRRNSGGYFYWPWKYELLESNRISRNRFLVLMTLMEKYGVPPLQFRIWLREKGRTNFREYNKNDILAFMDEKYPCET